MKVAQELLQSMGFRSFVPLVAACPGCGRTTSTTFQELARDIQDFIREEMPEWKRRYPGVETLTVAVMGCIVNGPGESKHADIGISLPGTGEAPAAPVFIDGKKVATLRGPGAAAEFKQMVLDYIERRFGQGHRPQRRGVGWGCASWSGADCAHACFWSRCSRAGSRGHLQSDEAAAAIRGSDAGAASTMRCILTQTSGPEGRGDDGRNRHARGRKAAKPLGAYRAQITALLRDKQETYSNLDGARCVALRPRTLTCFTDGFLPLAGF